MGHLQHFYNSLTEDGRAVTLVDRIDRFTMAQPPAALLQYQRFCEEALAPFKKRLAEAEEKLAQFPLVVARRRSAWVRANRPCYASEVAARLDAINEPLRVELEHELDAWLRLQKHLASGVATSPPVLALEGGVAAPHRAIR